MKNVSRTLYIVGMITNTVFIGLAIITAVLFGCAAFNAKIIHQIAMDMGKTEEVVKNMSLLLFIQTIIFTVTQFIVLVIAGHANRLLRDDETKVGSHIVLIIAGLFGMDAFYFIGGIFGVVTAEKNKK